MQEKKGQLFYLMGASGSGKDSLIQGVKECMPELVHAQRYITRPPSVGETHVPLSEEKFIAMQNAKSFCMDWHSHGLFYGIAASIGEELTQDKKIIVNGSREYLQKALDIFPDLIPILVIVPPTILEKRLRERGRETGADLLERIKRGQTGQNFPKQTRYIDNSTTLTEGIEQLYIIIHKN